MLANMTEFGRTPFMSAAGFEAMGYRMVICPVSSLRVANKAQEARYAMIRRDGSTVGMLDASFSAFYRIPCFKSGRDFRYQNLIETKLEKH